MIPEGFGLFRNNLVLHNKVCDSCNSKFGSTLDLKLARDTYEGLYRYQSGVKQPAEYRHLGKRSTVIIQIGHGRLKNAFAYFEYSRESGLLELCPLEQIGIKKRDSVEYDFFTFPKFPSPANFDEEAYDLKKRDCFIVLSERIDEARRLLAGIGIRFVPGSPITDIQLTDGDITVEITSTIDNTVRRAISKIALNYLAYWNSTELLCYEAFDPVRDFVLDDVKPTIPVVHPCNMPILGDEPQYGEVREGHIVTVQWNDYHDAILANVSLFNTLRYRVLLAAAHTDLSITVGKGHFWNIADMSVLELEKGRRSPQNSP